jgi:Holliday junction resolvase RusA-like endonuclease
MPTEEEYMPELTVTIPGRPRGQGSLTLARDPRTGKEFARHGQETVLHRNLVVGELRRAWGDREPLMGPVAVDIVARYPRPKSHFGTGRNAGKLKDSAPRWVITPVDADKVARLIGDAGTIAGIYSDDAQVAQLRVEKLYADSGPGSTTVEVFDLGAEP